MDSTCVSSSSTATKDSKPAAAMMTQTPHPPVNPLYKLPESVMSSRPIMKPSAAKAGVGGRQVKVVDSISCRQLYLRSYTFTREEDYKDTNTLCGRTKKYMDKAKIRIHRGIRSSMEDWINARSGGGRGVGTRKSLVTVKKKLGGLSSAAFVNMFHRLIACTAKVDVVDRHRG